MTTLEGVNSYTYDAHNWLTSATYPDARTQAFEYDAVGNRINFSETSVSSVVNISYSYNAANRLLSAGADTYTYDGAGRLIAQTIQPFNGSTLQRSYSYNFRGQMTSLTDTNGTTFTYDFDGDGNRISASIAGCLSARYVYDGPNVVLDLNASNQIVHAYIHGPGIDQPIERIDFINGEPRTRFVYHTDGLGSVVAMTDSAQSAVKTYAYEAFGRIRTETGDSLVINRYTYTGREALGDSRELYYYRARVMDSSVGRFSSQDPLLFLGGDIGLYRYVNNNPANYGDPFGLRWIPPNWPDYLPFDWIIPPHQGPSWWSLCHRWNNAYDFAVDMGQTPVKAGDSCTEGDTRWWLAREGTDWETRSGGRFRTDETFWWMEMNTIGIFSVNRAKCCNGKWKVTQDPIHDRIMIRTERWEWRWCRNLI